MLDIWIHYYNMNSMGMRNRSNLTNESLALEYSSGIEFDEWLDCVQELCDPDPLNMMSLEYCQVRNQ